MTILFLFVFHRFFERKHGRTPEIAGELRSDGPDSGAALGTGEHSLLRWRPEKRDAGRSRYRRRLRKLPHDQSCRARW